MTYDEQKYPISIDVRIEWADGQVHYDSIKGLNKGHALWCAWQNWTDAKHIWLVNVKA